MRRLTPAEAQQARGLVKWCLGSGLLLLLVGTYAWAVADAIALLTYALAVLGAVLMLIGGVWLHVTIPGLVKTEED